MAGDVMPVSADPVKGRIDGSAAPTVLRILLGTQLRRLRESRNITAQDAARKGRRGLNRYGTSV